MLFITLLTAWVFYCMKLLSPSASDFLLSFYASMGQDIIFFGLLGSIVILATYRLPSKESLLNRIIYLANNKKNSEQAIAYLSQGIKERLTYNIEAEIKLYVRPASEGILDIITKFETLARNMCSDIHHEKPLTIDISPNQRNGENDYGSVLHCVVRDREKKTILKRVYDTPEKLEKDRRHYQEVDFSIPKGEDINFELCFQIYASERRGNPKKEECSYFTLVNRYSDLLNLHVSNEDSQRSLVVSLSSDAFESFLEPVIIPPSENTKLYSMANAPAGSRIYMNMSYVH